MFVWIQGIAIPNKTLQRIGFRNSINQFINTRRLLIDQFPIAINIQNPPLRTITSEEPHNINDFNIIDRVIIDRKDRQ